jgi:hypothetical protein
VTLDKTINKLIAVKFKITCIFSDNSGRTQWVLEPCLALKTKKSDLLISRIVYHTRIPFVKEITQKMPLEKGIFWLNIAIHFHFLVGIKSHQKSRSRHGQKTKPV